MFSLVSLPKSAIDAKRWGKVERKVAECMHAPEANRITCETS